MPTEEEYKDNIKRFNHYMDLAMEESKKNHWRNVEEITDSARMCAEYMFVYKNSPYDKRAVKKSTFEKANQKMNKLFGEK